MQSYHLPVLEKEVLNFLKPQRGDSYLDLTAGYGGHASLITAISGNYDHSYLVDRDQEALNYLKQKFKNKNVHLIHSDFLEASKNFLDLDFRFNLILADLGISSQHINDSERGFSFLNDAILDMRMDREQKLDAYQVVNSYSLHDLQTILTDYGNEPKAYAIARLIVKSRPVRTTHELALICQKVWPGYHKIHPATRTFQAIRIEVNDELKQIQLSLPIWFKLLSEGGRLGVISFHSLEDRLVKNFFQDISGPYLDSQAELLTKKPISANQDELVNNPRSRSAKLRVVLKIKIKKERS
jgi:16S rRNA (cytosine1402-N4)-methyltransferase